MEVHITNSTASSTTIELLRKSFASLGLPDVLVSDNDTSFTSGEFTEFMRRNGVRHIRSPPYHPSSHGLAERAVQTLKEGLKRCTSGTLNTRLSRFLFSYRITPHTSTGLSPSEMLWGRKLHSPLDRLQPDPERKARQAAESQRTTHDSHAVDRKFGLSDQVYARNYGAGPKWLPGVIVGLQGSALYRVRLDNRDIIIRHIDQLRHRQGPGGTVNPTVDNLDSLSVVSEVDLPTHTGSNPPGQDTLDAGAGPPTEGGDSTVEVEPEPTVEEAPALSPAGPSQTNTNDEVQP